MALDFNTCIELPTGTIRTPKFRMNYPSLLTPNTRNEPRKDKAGKEYHNYELGMLIPPTADISMLRKAASDAAIEEHGIEKIKDWQARERWNSPFLDAFKKSRTERNPEGIEWMQGWILIRTKTKDAPQVVNGQNRRVDDESEIYGGRWAVATVVASAYPPIGGGNAGVGFYLQNVQLLDHDERIGGGRASAEDEFEVVVDTDGGTTDDVMGGDSDGGLSV